MTEPESPQAPRPFSVRWGGGDIVEEAGYKGEYHQPSTQLLQFEGGALDVRFCYYNHSGRLRRSPLSILKEMIG